jgi:hypothetical protein
MITFAGIERAEKEAIVVALAYLKVLSQNSPGRILRRTSNSIFEPRFLD